MADTKNSLPEGTDTVIEAGGAGGSGGGLGRSGTPLQGGSPSTDGNSTGARTSVTSGDSQTDSLITGGDTGTGSAGRSASSGPAGTGSSSSASGSASEGGSSDGSNSGGGIRGMVSNVSSKARDEAATRARGLVGDGLSRGSTTLSNISTLIGDTVEQIEEKLGPQYAGYARSASQSIDRYAQTLANKDPDELVDDARELVRKSPGVAIAGAAILGFGLVRLLKAGMPEGGSSSQVAKARDGEDRRSGGTA